MNRTRIYFYTLIFPLSILSLFVLILFISLGISFWGKLSETITENWYHILGGIISIIIGIELFGGDLENKLKTKKRFWVSFKYVMKIFGLFIVSNFLTNSIDSAKYIRGVSELIDNVFSLIVISTPIYLIMISVTSLIIGLIISKSKMGEN